MPAPSSRLHRFLCLACAAGPFVLLACLLLAEWFAARALTQGRFVYSLDDPYIHLALAESISRGFYGINPGEAAAPSSSVLWPFLLAPFARSGFFEYVPLALNSLFAALTVWVTLRLARLALAPLPGLRARALAAWVAILLIPAANLVGLAYTGMEHSLQVLLCAAAAYGLARVARGGETPSWLPVTLALAPLVRYECLAVSLPGIAVLLLARRWRAAAAAGFGALLPLAAFSLFLANAGLGWLPSSVLVKAGYAAQPLAWASLAERLGSSLELRQGRVLAGLFLALVWLAAARRPTPPLERALALAGALSVLAHLAFGQFGWWNRYEVYMLAFALLLALYLGRGLLAWLAAQLPLWAALAALAGLSLLMGQPYYQTLWRTPLASANIYEQQYQMQRFVTDYWRGPAAVNDLGWVAFGSPYYVLDLWGLSSREALEARMSPARAAAPGDLNQPGAYGGAWMDRLARQHQVELVMIYDEWFFGSRQTAAPPEGWVRLAELRLGQEWVVAGSSVVTFYAVGADAAPRLRALLREFRPTLPPGVPLTLYD